MTRLPKIALYAQLLWVVLALLYNCLSLLAIASGGDGFAGDAAATGTATLAVFLFLIVTTLGLIGQIRIYPILALLTSAALFAGGVMKHLYAGPTEYASQLSWTFAIAINCFGVIAYLAGFASLFHRHGQDRSNQ